MSDWTDEIEGYMDRNYEDLADEFVAKHDRLWQDFVAEKFFGLSLGERTGVNEDRGDR